MKYICLFIASLIPSFLWSGQMEGEALYRTAFSVGPMYDSGLDNIPIYAQYSQDHLALGLGVAETEVTTTLTITSPYSIEEHVRKDRLYDILSHIGYRQRLASQIYGQVGVAGTLLVQRIGNAPFGYGGYGYGPYVGVDLYPFKYLSITTQVKFPVYATQNRSKPAFLAGLSIAF